MPERIQHLEKAIGKAIQKAPPSMRAVVEILHALRGVAQVTAVTVVAELGTLSRFARPSPLMVYTVSREYSSGNHIHRGAIEFKPRLLVGKYYQIRLRRNTRAARGKQRSRRCSRYPSPP